MGWEADRYRVYTTRRGEMKMLKLIINSKMTNRRESIVRRDETFSLAKRWRDMECKG